MEGIAIEKLVKAAGISKEIYNDPDAFLSVESYFRVFQEAARLSGNEFFWLKKQDKELFSKGNIHWYYGANAPTVMAGLERVYKTTTLKKSLVIPEPLLDGSESRIRIHSGLPGVELPPCLLDAHFCLYWGLEPVITGKPSQLSSLEITSVSPERIQAYEDFFKVPVSGESSHNDLVFGYNFTELPNSYWKPDPNLDPLFERVIAKFKPPAKESAFEKKLRETIHQEIIFGTPTISQIADKMEMTTRTLQRRLKDQGISFSKFMFDFRNNLAAHYLKQSGSNISEVAFKVGYTKVGAFSQAFQKYHGVSPRLYRQNHLSQVGPSNYQD